MDYRIEEIDIRDAAILFQIRDLLSETFDADVSGNKLELNTTTNSPKPSLYLAAIQDGKVIGCNSFISHEMLADREPINCYQSCWTATSVEHRGKKIFQNLMNTAKDILRSRGGAFIFGFGNFNSQPILKNKLGFRETSSLKWQVPNIPFVKERYLGDGARYQAGGRSISQNDEQLIEYKSKTYGAELAVVSHEDSLIWGVTRGRKKAGIELTFFEIGGVRLDNAADLQPLFAKLWQQVRDVSYYQLAITSNNSFVDCFNNLKPAQTNDLIVFDLNLDTTGLHFNFFGGVKDVY